MEIRRRVTRLVKAAKPAIKKPPAHISNALAHLEAMAAYQRWLRGVLCLLAFVSFMCSLVAMENEAVEALSDAAVTILSLAGEVCIFKVYTIKAQHAGVTDPIYKSKPSVFHSPHFFTMLLEMLLWSLHCPPRLSKVWPGATNLDFFVVLRFYCVLLYLNNLAFGQRTFCRAMSAIADIPLGTSFYLRTSFIFDTFRTSIAVLIGGWSALALLYGKCEDMGFWDSMYFCFVTAATIGYGDISPKTTPGRLVAFFSWIFGLTVVAWVVGLTHENLTLSDAERNLFTLFQANDLCNRIPIDAAKVIQRAFRLQRARKAQRNIAVLNWYGYRLTTQVNILRRARRSLRSNEAAFMSELANSDGAAAEEDHRYRSNSARSAGKPSPTSTGVGSNTVTPTARSDDCGTPLGSGLERTSSNNRLQTKSALSSPAVVSRLSKLEQDLDQLIAFAESLAPPAREEAQSLPVTYRAGWGGEEVESVAPPLDATLRYEDPREKEEDLQ